MKLNTMKFKTIKRLVGIGLLLIIAAISSFAQKSVSSDETEVRKVVENFRIALIKKDKPLFLSLFLEGNIGWQTVTEDESLSRVKVKQPKAVKVFIDPKETYLAFIDWIAEDKKRTEETFSNIRINTDGDVASVGFDYAFLYDNRETNHGQEHWLLVRTENGWKITSVAWSTILPPVKLK